MGLQTVSIALSKQDLEGLDGELGERNADPPLEDPSDNRLHLKILTRAEMRCADPHLHGVVAPEMASALGDIGLPDEMHPASAEVPKLARPRSHMSPRDLGIEVKNMADISPSVFRASRKSRHG